MKILAVDTATEACSAALMIDGTIEERYRLAPREHNRIILPMIESLMEEAGLGFAQLDGIAFGRGPGSFTGVRITAGVVQGLALGASIPLIPISTLAALALEACTETGEDIAFAAIDARMGEVYWAGYRRIVPDDALQLITAEVVIPPEDIPAADCPRAVAIGSGWGTYQDVLSDRLNVRDLTILPDRFPRARAIARLGAINFRLGHTCLPEEVEPVYLRDNVARKPAAKV